jgi:hypothetical protein
MNYARVIKNQLPLTVGILIFDQVEVLDVAGPFEVLAVTRLNEERRQEELSPFRVLLVSESLDQVCIKNIARYNWRCRRLQPFEVGIEIA